MLFSPDIELAVRKSGGNVYVPFFVGGGGGGGRSGVEKITSGATRATTFRVQYTSWEIKYGHGKVVSLELGLPETINSQQGVGKVLPHQWGCQSVKLLSIQSNFCQKRTPRQLRFAVPRRTVKHVNKPRVFNWP